MSVCARQFFDCASGWYGDVIEARESGECFATVVVGDLGRDRLSVGEGCIGAAGDVVGSIAP